MKSEEHLNQKWYDYGVDTNIHKTQVFKIPVSDSGTQSELRIYMNLTMALAIVNAPLYKIHIRIETASQ